MSSRQLAIVFDINKCMGCQTCTVACKLMWTNRPGMNHMWWCKVNSMPGRGSPRDWEQMGGGYDEEGKLKLGKLPSLMEFGEAPKFNYEEVFYGGDLKAHLHPVEKLSWGPNWDEDLGGGEYPNCFLFYLPRICNMCTRPPCVEACPAWSRGAILKRPEDGTVVIDPEVCRRSDCQQECMRACPYKVIYADTATAGLSQKCNFCLPRLEQQVAPCCVRQCPGRAGWIDYLDNPEGPVYQLVKVWKVALPLHPEFNTSPNVYYVPPLSSPSFDTEGNLDPDQPRIPIEYLRSLFGPGVDQALSTLRTEKARRGSGQPSELMDILIARRWTRLLGPFTRDPAEVQAAP